MHFTHTHTHTLTIHFSAPLQAPPWSNHHHPSPEPWQWPPHWAPRFHPSPYSSFPTRQLGGLLIPKLAHISPRLRSLPWVHLTQSRSRGPQRGPLGSTQHPHSLLSHLLLLASSLTLFQTHWPLCCSSYKPTTSSLTAFAPAVPTSWALSPQRCASPALISLKLLPSNQQLHHALSPLPFLLCAYYYLTEHILKLLIIFFVCLPTNMSVPLRAGVFACFVHCCVPSA